MEWTLDCEDAVWVRCLAECEGYAEELMQLELFPEYGVPLIMRGGDALDAGRLVVELEELPF